MKKSALYLLLLSVSTMALCQKAIPLYTGKIPGSVQGSNNEAWSRDSSSVSRVSVPTLTIFFPEKGKETGIAVIICPGGGYRSLVMKREGYDVARDLNKIGVAAFVLKYRLPDDTIMTDKSIGPLQDAQQAIKIVRQNSIGWNINPNQVGIMGFSAGGHLASTAGTHFTRSYIENPEHMSLRPDFMILVYPVISMNETISHSGSREMLLGRSPVPEMANSFSNELQVTAQTPPAFLVHGRDDSKVPVENSILFFEALKKNNVKAGLHIFAAGEHGFPSGEAKNSWLRYCLDWIQAGSWQPERIQKINTLSAEETKAGFMKSKFNKYPGFIEKRPSGIVIQNHTEEAWFMNIKIRKIESNS